MTRTLDAADVTRKALRQSLLVLVPVVVIAAVVGWFTSGAAGVWGALLGGAIAGSFLLVTLLSVLLTVKATPVVTGGAIMGSWLLKVIIVIAALALLRDLTFYSKTVFGVVVLVSIVVVLAAETRVVLKARMLYVDPSGTGQSDAR
ncbi:hypothetical protein [Saccharothrix coeruleofusca]|uniref:hypothetical protein n=1 Tax=Saccharothrix coeruleofusca TaxID=33919 RepID=UPI001E49DF27|nr:hypothetical protein [Saccharothrix coeruleofusca]MBP2338775.1 chromate transport protein ChrA [Saccharothrix coeruleofusca]